MELKIGENASIVETVDDFALGCEQGANNTKDMVPKSGRAAYVFSDGKHYKAEANDPGNRELCFNVQKTIPILSYRSTSNRNYC